MNKNIKGFRKNKKFEKRNREKLKQKAKDVAWKIGVGSLALLWGIADGLLNALKETAEHPYDFLNRQILRKRGSADFWYYYDQIEKLTYPNFRVTLHRLQEKGLIEKKKNKFHLSNLGLKLLRKTKEQTRQQEWDNKWRIIMFDIPESRRNERNWLRATLINNGYKQLQKSVFIGKYPLKRELYKEIEAKKLEDYIKLLTVGEISDEEILSSFD